jgi:hypothetical protein
MRNLFQFIRAFTNWLGAFGHQLPMGFVTSSEIAYADWPEAARHPQQWKRCL